VRFRGIPRAASAIFISPTLIPRVNRGSNTFPPLRENSGDSSAIYLSARQINHRSISSVPTSPVRRPPTPFGPVGPAISRRGSHFSGPSGTRALASADRRNFANPNKTEAAVSANTCPRSSTKCEKCLNGPRSAKSTRPISTDSFPPTRRPDRALSVSGPEILIEPQREI